MHLKTLTIKGFKSFASSTTLRLEPGITAVVGPNGSGKSNVVDALTWVMGEQGAKNLRGGSMADVIFAGAGSRPPLGRAEVSLTIDNSDGALPIDYTEVTVTRTLFRGGGSEYQINGTPCRLLDVQELLSDTGLGRQMHVIVGQGRLDAVLTATPEERRGFIEEAAGVLKHRRRKERALRKLDSMAGDLARLKDLTAELRRQLGPLARQAAVARRARTIQAEVRDATARLLADDVVQTQALLEASDVDQAAFAARRGAAEEAERVARAKLAELAAIEATSASRLAEANQTWEELTAAAQSFAALAQVAAERARGLAHAPTPALGTDPEELERRAEAAQREEAELAAAIEEARSALDEAIDKRADAEKAETAAAQKVEILQREAAERREKIARAGGALASARSRHEAALAGAQQAKAALEAAEARLEAAREALREHEVSVVPAPSGVGEETASAEQSGPGGDAQARAAAEHEAATAALASAREAVAAANEARREAASDRATWAARRDTLAMSLRAQDATAELDADEVRGVVGALADEFTTDRGWENAIAALLGERATAALMADEASAVAALAYVREGDRGALRLAVLGSAPAGEAPAADAAVTPPEGVRQARTVVAPRSGSHEAQVSALLDYLLADAWVAESMAQARQWRAGHPAAIVACRSGEVVAPGWAATPGRGVSSVLELAAAHEEAEAEAEAATQAEAEATARVEAARQAEEQARTAFAAALANLRAADAEAARVAETTARLTSAVAAAEDDLRRATHVCERADGEVAERTTALASATAALAALENEDSAGPEGTGSSQDRGATLEAHLDEARHAREEATQAARSARSTETEARLTLRTAEEREKTSRGRADSLRSAARRERHARLEAERLATTRAAQLAVATQVRDDAQAIHELARTWAAEAQEQRAAIEAERAEALAATASVREEIDAATRRIAELTDAAHRDEVARAEQRMRLEALADRAMSELGLELGILVEEYGPHIPVPLHLEEDPVPDTRGVHGATSPSTQASPDEASDPEEASSGVRNEKNAGVPYVRSEQEKRLARATRDLAKLGKVNPLALEEHAALEERHQFLAEQLADLGRSREDLLRIVEEIDARVLEVFTAAWEDTAREFKDVFARLFPGGEGRLQLTDPDHLLTTGIEIYARPAGKKVTRLSLLSGGERSLAAVALLVAIFKARPSPFYVMDEVEAALDDTNLGRLLDIFTELRQNSQLIIITHQKRTMEVADALYGITMRDGVTQVVSQRLARAGDGA